MISVTDSLIILIAVEFLRKAQRGLIAVTRHTSARVPGLQMPTKAKNVFTEGKKGAKWRKKVSERQQNGGQGNRGGGGALNNMLIG